MLGLFAEIAIGEVTCVPQVPFKQAHAKLYYTVVGLPHSTLLQVLFMSFMYSTCSTKIGQQQKAPQLTMTKTTKQSYKPRLPCDDVCTMFNRRFLCSVISLQGRGKSPQPTME
jgi:hypothetical protein